MSGMKEIMKMRKKKWERYALLEGFAEHRYPKDSSYLTTSKSMTHHKNLNYGFQIIFKPLKYLGTQGQLQCKACSYTSPCSTVLVKQVTRQFHQKLGRARKAIHK
jgi:hypothetical protein